MIKNSFGLSSLTNTIYYGLRDIESNQFVGEKTDVTNGVIAIVFEWFINHMKEDVKEYSISYKDVDYKLTMQRKENN